MSALVDALQKGQVTGDYTLAAVLDGPEVGSRMLLRGGRPVWQTHSSGVLQRSLSRLQECTATGFLELDGTRVFVERFGAVPQIVVCGGGHVAASVVRLAKLLGLPVLAMEDRTEYAQDLRDAGADTVLCLPFAQALEQVPGGAETYFVVVTRAHAFDVACLEQILQKPAAYVGMMGSRGRAALVRRQLLEAGADAARVEAVQAPIGLAIGAKTAEEIALSILAQIVEVKNARPQTEGFAPALLAAMEQAAQNGQPAVLATIIARHGSTPREVGSKMLLLPDGTTVGSVGGGIMEYSIGADGHIFGRRQKRRCRGCGLRWFHGASAGNHSGRRIHRMKQDALILVRGGGDLATGTIHRLWSAGLRVLVLETAHPAAIRRQVSLCEAVYEGETTVEGLRAVRIDTLEQAPTVWVQNAVPILIDPAGSCVAQAKPDVLVDAILAKKNLGTTRDMAPLTIALGPGFTAGQDVDVVVETKRGHRLGRIIREGAAIPNTGIPGVIGGYGKERVIHAQTEGIFQDVRKIGDLVEAGEIIAQIRTSEGKSFPVTTQIGGILRGLLRSGYPVTPGFKVADVDPRREELSNCFLISDKSRCIAGSVLELVCAQLWN